jgi:hypothetical protein
MLMIKGSFQGNLGLTPKLPVKEVWQQQDKQQEANLRLNLVRLWAHDTRHQAVLEASGHS